MNESQEKKLSIGQVIDRIVEALSDLPQESQSVAIRAAVDHLGLQFPGSSSGPGFAADLGATALPASTDIKSLKVEKQPKSAIQMACVVAFYLKERAPVAERRNTITAGDIDNYFRQAAYPLPKVLSQLLPDAKNAGYFDPVSPGTYRLNAVGYNLVAHSLPRVSKKDKGK